MRDIRSYFNHAQYKIRSPLQFGEADGLGRPRAGTGRALHGGDRGNARQSHQSRVLSGLVCGGQSQEGGTHGLHAQTADDRERDAQTSDTPASGDGSGSCRGIAAEPGLDGDRRFSANCVRYVFSRCSEPGIRARGRLTSSRFVLRSSVCQAARPAS